MLLAVSVSTLEVADDVGLNAAVTPLGSAEVVNATLPVKPPVSVTVIVSVPLAPCLTESEEADELSEKPVVDPVTVTVKTCVLLAPQELV